MTRRINAAGRKLICDFEGYNLKSYRCPRGIWTCGRGSTGPDVVASTVWTAEECEKRFDEDLRKFEAGVEKLVKVRLSDNQFSSLVSFCYNLGLRTLENSTLLKLLNAGKYQDAAEQMPRFCHAGSVVLPGLVRRRAAERDLFLAR